MTFAFHICTRISCGASNGCRVMVCPYGASRSHSLDTPFLAEPACRRDLYHLHTTLTRDKYPCPGRDSKPTVPASERSQTHTINRAATGVGLIFIQQVCKFLATVATISFRWTLLQLYLFKAKSPKSELSFHLRYPLLSSR